MSKEVLPKIEPSEIEYFMDDQANVTMKGVTIRGELKKEVGIMRQVDIKPYPECCEGKEFCKDGIGGWPCIQKCEKYHGENCRHSESEPKEPKKLYWYLADKSKCYLNHEQIMNLIDPSSSKCTEGCTTE